MNRRECECEGQSDLTDLVDVEHIKGSMPAADDERDLARRAFYADLLRRTQRREGDTPR